MARNMKKLRFKKNCLVKGVEYRVIASMARNRINMCVVFLEEKFSATIIKYKEGEERAWIN